MITPLLTTVSREDDPVLVVVVVLELIKMCLRHAGSRLNWCWGDQYRFASCSCSLKGEPGTLTIKQAKPY